MMKHTKSLSTVMAITAATTMLTAFVPSATAAGQSTGAVASARSFRVESAKRNLFQEAVSTTAGGSKKWTLADSMTSTINVPKTKSNAEIEADAKAQQEREAAAQQAEAAQQQAASRSEDRESLTSTNQNSGYSSTKTTITSASGILDIARQFIGTPYVWGGTTPSGFDCSGFVQYVFAQRGIQLPRVDSSQRSWFQAHGTQVDQAHAQPGDFVWTSGHVGIYVGGGIMLDAPQPGQTVGYHSMSWASFEYYHLG